MEMTRKDKAAMRTETTQSSCSSSSSHHLPRQKRTKLHHHGSHQQVEIMEPIQMEIDDGSQLQALADPLPFARSYQLEALEKAIHENTIVFLETGSGKTLIAIMLLRSYAYMLRKPSRHIAVFLVPKVVLVTQQAEAVKMHTDLKVGMYWGDMGVEYLDAATWKKEIDEHEVLVMTPAILLRSLRHGFLKLDMIKLLIMDECHHAKGRDPYACIMKEFYHRELNSGISDLPRIFGMTASPIKSKVGSSEYTLSVNIRDLMTLMDSKVYTCVSEDVIAKFIPISTPKFKFYTKSEIPYVLFEKLAVELNMLKQQYELSLRTSHFTTSVAKTAHKRITKNFSSIMFCLDTLGVWLALKAAEFLSSHESESFKTGDIFVNRFSLDTVKLFKKYLSSGPQRFIGNDTKSDKDMGLLTSKVCCLVDTLLEYRGLSDMRCIVFVERVITAIVLQDLLNVLLPKYNSWKTKCIAGNNTGVHNQSRKMQNEIVEEFRLGMVNIIVATSILEEGLDVQSCNLVIRFDPCPTVCSFIQSRGRARMQNSDYVLMVQRGDSVTYSRLEHYLASGDLMRKESLRHSSLPFDHFESDQFNEEVYRVESTKAIVTLSSSIELIHIFCSWLPSDGYFKPTPRWVKETGTLHLPKSCPIQTICVEGDKKALKKIACLEACKQLHKIGALTDNLVPKIYVEEGEMQDFANEPFNEEQPSYMPCELVNHFSNTENTIYHCYLMELNSNFSDDISNIVVAMRMELDREIGSKEFQMPYDEGSLYVKLRYTGTMDLSPNQVLLCKRFQVTILRLLLDHNMEKLRSADQLCSEGDPEIDYLLLPIHKQRLSVDWSSINSLYPSKFACGNHSLNVWTKNGRVCTCMLRNALVYTPHNDHFYITTDITCLNGNSHLNLRHGAITTYKKYFIQKHGIKLKFEQQRLLKARHLYHVKNYCHGHKQQKDTVSEASKSTVELPPELCYIVMSPMPISTIYSFSFVPSIMHRVESLLVASNLKKLHLDHCMQNVVSTSKVLEALTSKSCGESFHYKSLKTLGDSFLKYATSQHLFQTYPNHHEGLLTVKREKIISNAALCKFGCSCNLPGFIRNSRFDPQTWAVPGNKSISLKLEELDSKGAKAFVSGKRKLRRKVIADVVEALIGAYLSTSGEAAALLFMNWVGIKVNFNFSPYERHYNIHPERLINVNFLESLLNYSFRDRHLLVEAFTHGSYMLPEIPRCYQRLEFLGDSVLDYLITRHLDNKYPGMSPGQLTDMRSASVSNDCYAWSAVKAGLHKHILHASQDLHKDIVVIVHEVAKFSPASPIVWELDISFPKVLGDIIESLAGAIFVDSEYNKEIVWQCIRPLLEPLVTPETLTMHPTRELSELCQKENYKIEKIRSRKDGVTSYLMEVQANGITIYSYEYTGYADKKTAKRIVCREILKLMKKTQPK
ncbi:endoribonuclease Dicer homolog 2 isoform X2 [Arachis duranensis]|uniref:Endoribonuclease Dicer homolog 2 isoform X2 n=1 Tax=Arachis duranensis TaxID=130453 RepID=A0A6P4D1M4_ARADU|nr:endoribonuclease Dicer homolog 2 isoform X2 [Arachis duranensis]